MPSDEQAPVVDEVCFPNGDYYEGEVLNRMPHGRGTMYYIDGIAREGFWRFGVPLCGPNVDSGIPGFKSNVPPVEVNVGDRTLCVGYGYDNVTIAETFGVSKYISGIRLHHDTAVLLSLDNSVYRDGIGWEQDKDGEWVFEYTGEGLKGDQKLTKGNYFLTNSIGRNVYLFVKRKPNNYTFNGRVEVKHIGEAEEPDKDGSIRKVYKFILRRI